MVSKDTDALRPPPKLDMKGACCHDGAFASTGTITTVRA